MRSGITWSRGARSPGRRPQSLSMTVTATSITMAFRLYMVLRGGQYEGFPIADIAGAAVRAAGLEVEVRSAIRDDDEPFRIMTLLLNKMPRNAVEPIITALQRSMGRDQASLEELAPLTWGMIGEMHDGGITIGSHTSSHALLTSESLESAKRELVDSRVALESRLKGNVRH